MYDARVGRFASGDPIDYSNAGIRIAGGGNLQSFLSNPQNLNRYSYCLNNPLKYIDPDGLLTILIHGTFSKPGMFKRRFIKSVEKTFNEQHRTIAFKWSGKDTHKERIQAAKNLANLINKYNFAEGEKLNIVAHSHGGNVAFLASQERLQRKIDNLVALGTPIREYRPNRANIQNLYNVYSKYDRVQSDLGGSKHKIFGQEYGPAGQVLSGAQNIHVEANKGDRETHGYLHSSEVWEKFIKREIK